MRAKTRKLLLVFIFVFAAGIRLYFASQSVSFTPEAYFEYRQVANIRQTGFPIIKDSLSYGGREFLFLPEFHYLLAFFSLFLPFEFILMVLPNIFSALIVFVVYLLTKHITKNEYISLFTSLSSAFIPIYFVSNLNSISPLSLQIPLIFFTIYCFAMSNETKYLVFFTILSFILPLMHGSAILLIFTFALYLSLGKMIGFKVGKKSTELILFYVFISLWILLIFFKKAFLTHGFSIIWQNIPFAIRNQYFMRTTMLQTILSIGLLPILSGAYACYVYVLRIRDKCFYLLLSFSICLLVLIWSRLITPILGLSLLGIILIIFSGALLNVFHKYMEKTKLAKIKFIFVYIFVCIFILNLITLTFLFASQKITVAESDFQAINFLSQQERQTVLAPMELGHAITALSNQPNVADTTFLLVENVEQRIHDINTVYNTPFQIRATTIMDKYDVKYIYLPENKSLSYVDERCFDLIYNESIKIYRVKCNIKSVEKP